MISPIAILSAVPPFVFDSTFGGTCVCIIASVTATISISNISAPLVAIDQSSARMVSMTESIDLMTQFTLAMNPMVIIDPQIGCTCGE